MKEGTGATDRAHIRLFSFSMLSTWRAAVWASPTVWGIEFNTSLIVDCLLNPCMKYYRMVSLVTHEPGYHRIKPAYIFCDPLGGPLPHLRERYQGILLPGFGLKLSQKGRL